METIKQILRYLRFIGRRFVEDRCLMVAGSLTFTTLLAIVPIFTVTITLTSKIAITRDFILALKAFLIKTLVPDVATRLITTNMEQFAQNAAKLTYVGLIVIIATAIALMFTIDGVFNDIWRARRRRSWWRRLLSYTALLTLGPLLIGASLSVTTYVAHWTHRFESVLPLLDNWLLRLIPFALTAAALVIAYRTIPNRYVPKRHAIAGGIFAALLFELVKHLFVFYIGKVPTYSLVYGAFASVPIFLAWLFCCWTVVLIGAEITATFSYFQHVGKPFQHPERRQQHAREILDAVAASEEPIDFSMLRFRVPMPIAYAEDLLDELVSARYLKTETVGRATVYRMAIAREEISEAELRRALGLEMEGLGKP